MFRRSRGTAIRRGCLRFASYQVRGEPAHEIPSDDIHESVSSDEQSIIVDIFDLLVEIAKDIRNETGRIRSSDDGHLDDEFRRTVRWWGDLERMTHSDDVFHQG